MLFFGKSAPGSVRKKLESDFKFEYVPWKPQIKEGASNQGRIYVHLFQEFELPATSYPFQHQIWLDILYFWTKRKKSHSHGSHLGLSAFKSKLGPKPTPEWHWEVKSWAGLNKICPVQHQCHHPNIFKPIYKNRGVLGGSASQLEKYESKWVYLPKMSWWR